MFDVMRTVEAKETKPKSLLPRRRKKKKSSQVLRVLLKLAIEITRIKDITAVER